MALGTFTARKSTSDKSERQETHAQGGEVSQLIRSDLLSLVNWHENNTARTLQTKIGPSEYGHPCARNVALKLAGTPVTRSIPQDVWPSFIGSACHDRLSRMLAKANASLGVERFLSEQRVTVAEGVFAGCGADAHLTGSCDLYDRLYASVIDAKFLGKTQHTKYLKGYVSDLYRAQIHGYGLGIENMGLPVKDVCLAVFARQGDLDDLFVWSEPYDRDLALSHLARLRNIRIVVEAGTHPNQIRATPTKDGCWFCPWRRDCPEGSESK